MMGENDSDEDDFRHMMLIRGDPMFNDDQRQRQDQLRIEMLGLDDF